MRTMYLLLVLLNISFHSSSAQTRNNNFALYNRDNSPLSSNNILKVILDKNDIYWILVDDEYIGQGLSYPGGVFTFNGSSFYPYDSTNSPLVNIADIAVDNNSNILFASYGNGILVKSESGWLSYDSSNSPFPSNDFFRISVDKENNYWAGIPNQGVALIMDSIRLFYNYNNSFSGIEDFNFIKADSLNNIWIGTDFFGLHFFNWNKWVKVIDGTSSNPGRNSIVGLAVDKDNIKWAAIHNSTTGHKIAKIVSDTIVTFFDSTNFGSFFNFFSYDGVVIDNKNIKYFGTTHGLLRFDDVTWSIINTSNSPIPGNYFRNGFVDYNNNKIFAISNRSTLPYSDLGLLFYNEDSLQIIISGVEEYDAAPNTYYLHQNYPNPFNPSTTIKYHLSEAGNVDLRLYDILGKEISVLEQGYKNAGTYEVYLNASPLSSGVYFYRLKLDSFSAERKMILIK
jgi:hypothetical protein